MNKFTPEEISRLTREHSDTSIQEAKERIEELAKSVDAVRLFVAAIGHLSFAAQGTASELTHGDVPAKVETLAYYLYPFFGESDEKTITPRQMEDCLESLDQLVNMRLMKGLFTEEGSGRNHKVDAIARWTRLQAEIVRGSAFPEQTGEEISEIQGRFDRWFAKEVGISPTRAKDFLWGTIQYHEDAINGLKPQIRENVKSVQKYWLSIRQKPASQRSEEESRALEVFKEAKHAGAVAYEEFPYIVRRRSVSEPVEERVRISSELRKVQEDISSIQHGYLQNRAMYPMPMKL